jgi:hypothetical protein
VSRSPRISRHRFCALLFPLVLLTACNVSRRPNDPRLEWDYAVATATADRKSTAKPLPSVELRAEEASLGAVVRDIAVQAGVTVVYPDEFEHLTFTGELHDPAESILDAVARQHELRFALNNGVGLIGKPLPDDRQVAAIRTWIPEPAKTVNPLLSEGGKCTESGGWLFVADRAENVSKVLRAVGELRPKSYLVQILETYQSDSFDVGVTVSTSLLTGWANPFDRFNSTVQASLESRGAYLGRTWLGFVSEGRVFAFFQGIREKRTTTTILPQNPQLLQSEDFLQVGWKFDITVVDGLATGAVRYDAEGQQYTVPFSVPNPGLYLINSAAITTRDASIGVPATAWTSSRLHRSIWLRYFTPADLLTYPQMSPSSN